MLQDIQKKFIKNQRSSSWLSVADIIKWGRYLNRQMPKSKMLQVNQDPRLKLWCLQPKFFSKVDKPWLSVKETARGNQREMQELKDLDI